MGSISTISTELGLPALDLLVAAVKAFVPFAQALFALS
ncbi:hypothetical protein ABH922_002711 [Rhodococcus sp. 27YEA15]